MESDPSQGTRASETGLLDSLRDFVAFFVHYVELRLQLLGLESRETGFHLLFLALLFVSTVICFGGFVIMVVVFLLYLMMLTLHWEWGLERLGACWDASRYQYWNGDDLQIQNREAVFPGDHSRVSEGS
jgi:uncharacterized membrane protein YqjE